MRKIPEISESLTLDELEELVVGEIFWPFGGVKACLLIRVFLSFLGENRFLALGEKCE